MYRQTNLRIYTKQVKLVMNKQCTKILQKHTKNVIPINLTHDHVQKLDENEAYVTIKDHKE